MGDDMGKKEKSFKITFVSVGDNSNDIVKKIVKSELKKMLDSHGVVSYNLDDVLSKYITGDMRYEQKG
ncbi:hypothetical protein ABIE27_004632 [Paenibacillus sp. 4624]|uniref:hypothetical protein n=1 Tax=Paenibacillus sp. 4624 TaxID=3156453 RepID=UPI003D19C98A